MPFVPKAWRNKSAGPPVTPVTAEDLNRIEQGIATATGLAEAGGASDEQVAELVSDPETATGQALATTYGRVKSVNGADPDPSGNINVAGTQGVKGDPGEGYARLDRKGKIAIEKDSDDNVYRYVNEQDGTTWLNLADNAGLPAGMQFASRPTSTGRVFSLVIDGYRVWLEAGTDGMPTDYAAGLISRKLPLTSPADPTSVLLPSTLHEITAQPHRMLFSHIVPFLSPTQQAKAWQIAANGTTYLGNNDGPAYNHTPAAPGSGANLTVQVLDRADKIVTTRTVPVVVHSIPSSDRRLLWWGDSTVRNELLATAVQSILGGTMIGTRTFNNGSTAHEGRGGWSFSGYFRTDQAAGMLSPLLFPVGIAADKYKGSVSFWANVINSPTAYDWAGFQKIAKGWTDVTSGSYLYGTNGYPLTPTEGDVVFDKDKPAGQAVQQYTSGAWVAMNPQPAFEVNFTKYMAGVAAPMFAALGQPTCIPVLMGINDAAQAADTPSAASEFVTNLTTLITSIRAWSATVPVVICMATLGGPQANWTTNPYNKMTSLDLTRRLHAMHAAVLATFDTQAARDNKVFLAPIYAAVDDANYGTDYVHYNATGAAQAAPFAAGAIAQALGA